MARGPHDEEIEKDKLDLDKARERRDELLRQRGIPIPEWEGETNEEDQPDRGDAKNPKKQ